MNIKMKNKLAILSIGITFIFLAIGLSFAYFMSSVVGNDEASTMVVTTANL